MILTSINLQFSYAFRLVVKGQGEFLAHAKTEELMSQWIDAINHAKYVIFWCVTAGYGNFETGK